VRSSNEQAIKHMQDFKTGLSGALKTSLETSSSPTGRMRVMAAAVEETDKSLRELNSEEFYPFIEGAGEKLVVIDFYTDWCGPCKVMLPLLEELAEELSDKIDIVKFNCNAKNKELGKTLNVKVAPTFHLYKNNNKVAEMTGAKIDELKELINANL
jgi:thioredoxin 1